MLFNCSALKAILSTGLAVVLLLLYKVKVNRNLNVNAGSTCWCVSCRQFTKRLRIMICYWGPVAKEAVTLDTTVNFYSFKFLCFLAPIYKSQKIAY